MNIKMLQDLLEKRLTRREFLTYVGAAIVAMTGIHTFLKTLTNQKEQSSSLGYSSGVYGGNKKGL
ncbi:MAG: twin-arginine translocation signal domain-containing protein [bacterium]|nr:twin-arginine translocation signal domain-containing protein [bacterium]